MRASASARLPAAASSSADAAEQGSRLEGIDLCPEGGAAIAAARLLRERGVLGPDERVVLFNTGAGWLYREPAQLLRS
jgi:threonine synthase